jgi:hypothetical protein
MLYNRGSLTISNSHVRYSAGNGIYSRGTQLSVADSTIASNDNCGIQLNHQAHLRNNAVVDNGAYGVYNLATSQTIDARYNWWGSDSGPAPYGSGNGINYTTSCTGGVCTIIPYVDVIPWLGAPPTLHDRDLHKGVHQAEQVNAASGNQANRPAAPSISTPGTASGR